MRNLIFASDLDDCILHTSSYIEKIMREEYGVYINPEEVTTYGFEGCIPETKKQVIYDVIKYALEHSNEIPIIEGAIKILNQISKHKTNKLYIVSRRASYLYDLTKQVLHYIGLKNFELILTGKDNFYTNELSTIRSDCIS